MIKYFMWPNWEASDAIRLATDRDSVLFKAREFLTKGWLSCVGNEDLRQFHSRKNELTIETGCFTIKFYKRYI